MPDDLEQIFVDDPEKTWIVILNYPANPTGGTYKTEDLKDLARVARAHRIEGVSLIGKWLGQKEVR